MEVFRLFIHPLNRVQMDVLKQVVGIDISKDDFVCQVIIKLGDGSCKYRGKRKFHNRASGFSNFIKWLKKKLLSTDAPTRIVMEATGVYHQELAYWLNERGYQLSIVLPNKVKAFAHSLNKYSKTDNIDAKIIAQFGSSLELDVWQPMSDNLLLIRTLYRERLTLQKDKNRISNQLHAYAHSARKSPTSTRRKKRLLKEIIKQIEQIEVEINAMCEQSKELQEQVDILCSIPGVGLITAIGILAETDGFRLFNNRAQLIKYAGLDVVEKQSGSSIRGKGAISKRVNSKLRQALFLPSMSAKTHGRIFKTAYDRHFEKNKCGMQALVAVQRKLLLVMFALSKSQHTYDEAMHRDLALNRVGEPLQLAYSDSI